ncbi:MAG: hypothetical protein HYY40_08945 [Bacteroidetes bacterium]|nr:hypothetical protein [Bacteroidota bacterium]
MRNKALIVKFICFIICLQADSQGRDTSLSRNKQFFNAEFRINWIGNHYSKYFYDWYLDERIATSHPFIYAKYKKYPNDLYADETISLYKIFYLGLTLQKYSNKIIANKQLFFRFRFDIFSYDQNYLHTHTPYKVDSTSKIYEEKYNYSVKSWQLTPGLGSNGVWKIFDYKWGIELPLYLRDHGHGTWEINEYEYGRTNKKNIFEQPFYSFGGYFIGLSIFGDINIKIIKGFHMGFGTSSGIIIVYPFADKIIDGLTLHKINMIVHNPSLIISYKF